MSCALAKQKSEKIAEVTSLFQKLQHAENILKTAEKSHEMKRIAYENKIDTLVRAKADLEKRFQQTENDHHDSMNALEQEHVTLLNDVRRSYQFQVQELTHQVSSLQRKVEELQCRKMIHREPPTSSWKGYYPTHEPENKNPVHQIAEPESVEVPQFRSASTLLCRPPMRPWENQMQMQHLPNNFSRRAVSPYPTRRIPVNESPNEPTSTTFSPYKENSAMSTTPTPSSNLTNFKTPQLRDGRRVLRFYK